MFEAAPTNDPNHDPTNDAADSPQATAARRHRPVETHGTDEAKRPDRADQAGYVGTAEFGTAEYRLRPAMALRVIGLGCVGLVLPVALDLGRRTVTILDLPILVVLTWICLAALAVVILTGCWLLLDRRPRLRLDDDGLTNRTTYGMRTFRTSWKQVRGVRRVADSTGPLLVIQLGDDRTATILPRYLDGNLPEIETQLRSRLNTAHGYRLLTPEDTRPNEQRTAE